ncbi:MULTISPECIES: MFS transporter [Actinomadura]|uniref:Major Facilitator Superfamily protein n=1 Tax=Actinomadura madurae TaxID=1993 RepID=A0A1I5K6R5_9ACTN|nr:MFS transporter [Actinomadura madurae]SFO80784.1 Major Facilitator Superfamily protein [Actinomadura madurae]SPT56679.1 Spectinomycin tetracycline efflux pump [Actinomadura madurae]
MTGAPAKAREETGRPPADARHTGITLLALAAAGMVVSVQQTLVLPLLPRLMEIFDVSITAVTWVFTASLLAGAVATPLLTRFGDMYGKKRMVLLTLALLLAGSVLCAVSGSLPVLIGGRALQGVSAALIPLSIGMIRDTFPAERVTTAIGIVSATMGVGGSAGMIVTGLIATRTSSHHPVFWVAAALAAAVLVLVAVTARDVGVRAGGRPDVVGAAVLAVWLAALLLGISQGNAWGWTSGRVLGLFGGAAVLCAAWVVIELRVRAPLVRLNLLVGPRSLSANVISALLGFSMFAAFTLIAGFVQAPSAELGYGLDGSVLDVGLYMLPSTATMLVFSAMAGRIAARIGTAYTLATGSAFAGLCYAWLAVSNSHPYDMLAFSSIQGIGFGIAYAALGTLAVRHVPMDQSGIASGINSLVRTTGGSIAGAATASILAGRVVAGSGAPTLGAYETCFWIVAAGAALAALIAVAHAVRHPV